MKARILKKKEEPLWDEFLQTQSLASIAQFSIWGHFQEKCAYRGKYWIVVLENDQKEIMGGTMVIRYSIRKGYCWIYGGRGPMLNYESEDLATLMDTLVQQIEEIAHRNKAIFLRMDPPLIQAVDEEPNNDSALANYTNLKGYKRIEHGFQPQDTLVLDITQTNEDLLKQMKPKGRYNIRLATKKGVKIRKANPKKPKQFEQDIDAFFKILRQTTKRDGFSGHGKSYYKNMIETLQPSGEAELYLAEYEGKIIAGNIVTFDHQTAIYYYGASSSEHRNVMAPYLLQWQAILDAKKRDLKYYDFLGIAPANSPGHPWAGVTNFKKKFGGQHITYVKPLEKVFKSFFYLLFRIYKKLH